MHAYSPPDRWARKFPFPVVIASGLMLVLSFPPFPTAFLAYIAFVPLLLAMDHVPERVFEDRFWGSIKGAIVVVFRALTLQFLWRKTVREHPWYRYKRRSISRYAQIFRFAYTAFLIWNVGCCYWLLLTSTGVEGFFVKLQALSAGLSAILINPFLMAIPVWGFAKIRRLHQGFWLSLTFVPLWLAFEYLHFHWELSWSWLTLGHSQSSYPFFLQYTEYTGVLGISLHILLVNVLVYQALRFWRFDRKSSFRVGGAVLGLLLLPALLNPLLTRPGRSVLQPVGELRVRLVQPNVDPYEKFSLSNLEQVEAFARQIEQDGLDTVALAILPETAIPTSVWRHQLTSDAVMQPLWRVLRRNPQLSILTGLVEVRRIDPEREKIGPSARELGQGLFYEYYNASALLTAGLPPQTFQKGKLVPMVERMPYLDYLSFLKEYSIDLGGSFGNYGFPPSMHPLTLPDSTRLASLVCYESEYGDYIRPLMRQGANLLVVITNDGWWNFDNDALVRKGSSGHIQHAGLSVLRAIESRREVARSANTGISMFVDVLGQVHQPTEYWEPALVDRRCKLYDGETFYTRHGDYLGWISVCIALGLLVGIPVFRKFQRSR